MAGLEGELLNLKPGDLVLLERVEGGEVVLSACGYVSRASEYDINLTTEKPGMGKTYQEFTGRPNHIHPQHSYRAAHFTRYEVLKP
ncbi:MAG TPA: AbrB/MazE/SpoVT family DNA-binding domain-containing protein [Candidatus Nanoarchaeia archaeon]|nr:AbrB/MazE/SpoVT family DNA-binding domain-containing protein [Candidatus Nanoarchaeia archaeon]